MFPRLFFVFLLFLFLLNLVNCDTYRVFEPESEWTKLLRDTPELYWGNVSRLLLSYAQEQSNQVQKQWEIAVKRSNLHNVINRKCFEAVEQIIMKPLEFEWSAQMIDSTGRLPSGLLAGTTTHLGDFDQCLAIRGENDRWGSFSGRYCLATLSLPRSQHFGDSMTHPNEWFNQSGIPLWMVPFAQKWLDNDNFYSMANALCFPSLCESEEIRTMIMAYMPNLNHFEFNVTYCQTEGEPQNYHPYLYIALGILLAPWILIIPATLLELITKSPAEQNFIERLIKCFSLISNTKILFEIKTGETKNGADFQFIHGIRALGSMLIVLAHSASLLFVCYQTPVSVISRHPFDMIQHTKTLYAQPLINGTLVVLTFFSISGFLMVHLSASSGRLKRSFSQYVVARLLRLTPPLIGILCLTVCVELLGSGPLWHHDILWPTLKGCYENWWIHLLYFANSSLNLTEMCGVQLWFLSAEFQVYVIAFVILLAYAFRGSRATYLTCVGLVLIGLLGMVSPVILGYVKTKWAYCLTYTKIPLPSHITRYIYFAIPMQLIPFGSGAIIGLLILENRNLKLSTLATRFYWVLSLFFITTIPFVTYLDANNEKNLEGSYSVGNATVFALCVLIWCLSNAWVLYQCAINPENSVARFLSANFWKPFSRLSFCLYLTHVMAIWYNAYQTRNLLSLASMQEFYKNNSIVMLSSFAFGYFLFVTFEAPSVRLVKLFTSTATSTKDKKQI